MSKIFEAMQDEKQAELEFNEKERELLDKYLERMQKRSVLNERWDLSKWNSKSINNL